MWLIDDINESDKTSGNKIFKLVRGPKEYNAMSPARAQTQAARSGDERTNHEATAPLTDLYSFQRVCLFQVKVK